MKILTKDERLLIVLQIGEVSKDGSSEEQGTTVLKCRTDSGKKVAIQQEDIKCWFGSFVFPPED